MKLTSLEIEYSRRNTELEASLERVEVIRQRLKQIEADQSEMLQMLQGNRSAAAGERAGSPSRPTPDHLNY